jgi:guanine nucleotide-binding protein G(i) subunit alpha
MKVRIPVGVNHCMTLTNCQTGGPDYAAACDYILNRFVSLNQHDTKQVYTHFTCATDTTQIRFVMAAVNGT